MTFNELWAELAPLGRDADTGGYRRPGWSQAVLEAESWFLAACADRNLVVETDSIGNHVAWWRPAPGSRDPGIVTGSHLDSVPDGGAFDGPLGVVSALAAVDLLRARGFAPAKPLGVAAFVEEEGSRFGMPCLGSRLATGVLDPAKALALTDRSGESLFEAYEHAGAEIDRETYGTSELPAMMSTFVELHVEQGRWLSDPARDAAAAVGVATAIWPHGRWRLEFGGRADHAGTTRMEDRMDPMLTAAFTVLSANKQARLGRARATVGRLEIEPGATNAVPEKVRAWLDIRGADQASVEAVLAAVSAQVTDRAARDGTTFTATSESFSPLVDFDRALADRLADIVGSTLGDGSPAPLLPTAAGHDAGILAAAGVLTAMLFVRNPTGISHSPAEHADLDDCLAGVEALAAVLADLAGSA